MIIDTHLHIVDRSVLRYPWVAGVPELNRDFPYDDYAREAKRGGISQTLHMEVDVDPADIEAETAYVVAKAKEAGSSAARRDRSLPARGNGVWRLSGAPAVKPLREGLSARSARDARRAFRKRDFPVEHQAACRHRPALRPLRPSAPDPEGDRACRSGADVQFILDHCGVPDIKGNAEHPWREHITEIARRPNVVAKISGVVAYSGEELDRRNLAPIGRAYDRGVRLGPRRVGQRLAGLYAGRRPVDLDRGNPRAHRRRKR